MTGRPARACRWSAIQRTTALTRRPEPGAKSPATARTDSGRRSAGCLPETSRVLSAQSRSGINVVKHTQSRSTVRRTVTAGALACALIVASAAGAARAAVLKGCPSESSLSSAAGMPLQLDSQTKSGGQITCGYGPHGSPLEILTVQTLSTGGQSPAAYLKNLEGGDKTEGYKVQVLHGLGSAAFEGTIKGSSTDVDVLASGQIVHVGSLVVSPAHVVAVARAVVG